MTTIYLIRHAEAEGNLYRRIHGQYDSLVTTNGYRQIRALEQRFSGIKIDAVYSSDLFRTMTTARAIYVPRGLPLHTRPDLREMSMGEWEDRSWAGMSLREPERMAAFSATDPAFRAPGGESFPEVRERGPKAILDIAAKHPDQTVAVFAHGTFLRNVMAEFMGVGMDEMHKMGHSDNTAVNRLEVENGTVTVVSMNDNSHLNDEISTLAHQKWWKKGGKQESDINLWSRPASWPEDKTLYVEARREAWQSIHGDLPFEPQGFLRDAERCLAQSPWGVTIAMKGRRHVAGILQLEGERWADEGAGYIPFCYVAPEYRNQRLGIQLIGKAVSCFRPLGRDKLRLRCAPDNAGGQHFYLGHGFVKIGEESGSAVPLDILEKYIGYEYRGELD